MTGTFAIFESCMVIELHEGLLGSTWSESLTLFSMNLYTCALPYAFNVLGIQLFKELKRTQSAYERIPSPT